MKLSQYDLEYIKKTGMVILPEELEHETFETLLEALTEFPDREIKLYCRGNGGSGRTARAMVDVIRQHGNVTGMLTGEAASMHGVIWAGCARRYIYPLGILAIHRVAWSSIDTRVDANYARLLANEYEHADQITAQIFAECSTMPCEEWLTVLAKTGSGAVTFYDAAALIGFGMAQPISSYNEQSNML